MSYQDPSELLGEAPPALSFLSTGETVRGTIVNMTTSQQRAYSPEGGLGDLLFWADGRPRLQVVITLQTKTDKSDPHDGLRRLFVKTGSQLQHAIKQAVKDAGRSAPTVGSFLKVTYDHDEPSRGGGSNKKIYEVVYVPNDHSTRPGEVSEIAHQEALSGQGF